MNCLRQLQHWDRGFESYLTYDVYVRLVCGFAVLGAGSGFATG
jgi:hypothetical protein